MPAGFNRCIRQKGEYLCLLLGLSLGLATSSTSQSSSDASWSKEYSLSDILYPLIIFQIQSKITLRITTPPSPFALSFLALSQPRFISPLLALPPHASHQKKIRAPACAATACCPPLRLESLSRRPSALHYKPFCKSQKWGQRYKVGRQRGPSPWKRGRLCSGCGGKGAGEGPPLAFIYNIQINQNRYNRESFDFMQPVLHHPARQNSRIGNAVTSTIKYELKDDPFIVPIKFKRELPINKNFFELQEIQPKNYHQNDQRVEMSEMTMLDPLLMSIATIKFLLLEKIVSYTSLFSIGLSVYQVYYVSEEEIISSLTLFHTAITVLLLICVLISAGFHYHNNKSRMMGQQYMLIRTAFKIILILISPNPWWGGNSLLLHLALLGRLFSPLTLYIRSTLYYSPRAARIIHLYGIKPEMTFEFAWKVVLNNMDIMEVIFIYIAVVVFFSHCLFLASEDIPFNDCFEIVIVTLPTVGFGEYIVQDSVPRVVIIIILMTGVGLNAFVTLILLKKFEMTTNQSNSYILMEKLNMIEQIQQLSSQFIIRKFQKKRARSAPLEKEKDQDFKQRYRQCKARYRKMNPQDSAYQFNFFKNSLLNLKIKIYQVNNMINVLLARLIHFRRERKSYFKHMKDK